MRAETATTWDQVHTGAPAIRYEHALSEAGEGPINLRIIEACERAKAASEALYYSELLRVLTHRCYPPREAKALWQRILEHRSVLRKQLGRNPGVAVAAMDLLANVERHLALPTLRDHVGAAALERPEARDPLTGLYTRHVLQQALRRALSDDPRRLSVLMLAIDSFEAHRVLHGALATEHVLARLGELIRSSLRASDIAVRCEGEELCILMPGRFLEEALILGHRLRDRIASELSDHGITVSLGVAAHPHHATDAAGLLEAASRALNESQRAGRNRLSVLPCEALPED